MPNFKYTLNPIANQKLMREEIRKENLARLAQARMEQRPYVSRDKRTEEVILR